MNEPKEENFDREVNLRTGIGGAAITALIMALLAKWEVNLPQEAQAALIPLGAILAMLYDLGMYKLKKWVERMRS